MLEINRFSITLLIAHVKARISKSIDNGVFRYYFLSFLLNSLDSTAYGNIVNTQRELRSFEGIYP